MCRGVEDEKKHISASSIVYVHIEGELYKADSARSHTQIQFSLDFTIHLCTRIVRPLSLSVSIEVLTTMLV
jgi:hypothetical protein